MYVPSGVWYSGYPEIYALVQQPKYNFDLYLLTGFYNVLWVIKHHSFIYLWKVGLWKKSYSCLWFNDQSSVISVDNPNSMSYTRMMYEIDVAFLWSSSIIFQFSRNRNGVSYVTQLCHSSYLWTVTWYKHQWDPSACFNQISILLFFFYKHGIIKYTAQPHKSGKVPDCPIVTRLER